MMSKGTTKLKKDADAWFSKYIRLRDSIDGFAECITCGNSKPIKSMQNGHFVTRGSSSLRFDELNCNAQCPACNVFKAGEQYLYSKALDLKYGDGTAESLMERRFETKKWTAEELEKIIFDAKAYIKEMS